MFSAFSNTLVRSSRPAIVARQHHCQRVLTFRRFLASSVGSDHALLESEATKPNESSTDTNETTNFQSNNHKNNHNENNHNENNAIRLSKFLSHDATNLALSRRQAERLIRDGAVTLAGSVVRQPHLRIDLDAIRAEARDHRPTIKLEGKPVLWDEALERANESSSTSTKLSSVLAPRVWAVHKLKGEVVTEHDPYGRPSLMDRLRQSGVGKTKRQRQRQRQRQTQTHLKPIGRLDMPTEGLILVTNDGGFAREMELPSSKIHRVYRARVHGRLTPHKLDQIRRGSLVHEGVRYPPMNVSIENSKRSRAREVSSNTWLRVTCTEGKNRQVRNVFAALGLSVTRLIRTAYGDYKLESIPPGMALPVPYKAIAKQRARGPLESQLPNRKTNRNQRRRQGEERAAPVKWVTSIP
mmetsp:Transcript_27713/g.65097  ORF Transcript_27713/g.65097 Transcript_27713/m.65097 type:complete len:411 (-) Transcript_27713:4370-5602(-)